MSQGRTLLLAALIGGALALAGAGVGAYFAIQWMNSRPDADADDTTAATENPDAPALRVRVPGTGNESDINETDADIDPDAPRLPRGTQISFAAHEGTSLYQIALMYGGNSIVLPGADGHRPEVIELTSRDLTFEGRHSAAQIAWIRGLDDGSRFFAITEDGGIDVYRRDASGNYVRDIRNDRLCDFPTDVDVSSDGVHAAFVCSDLTIRMINIESGRAESFRGSRGGFVCATFSSDGTEIIGASQRNELYIWNVESGERLLRVPLHDSDDVIVQVGWLGDTNGFFAVTAYGELYVWTERPSPRRGIEADVDPDFSTTIVQQPLNLVETVTTAGRFAVVTGGTEVQLWNVDDMVRQAQLDRERGRPSTDPQPALRVVTPEQILSFSVDETGSAVATALASGTIMVLPLEKPRSPGRRRRG